MKIKGERPLLHIGWRLLSVEEAMDLDLPQAARWPYWGWFIMIGRWGIGLAIKTAEPLEG